MKAKNSLKLIYKLHSRQLRKANWNLELSLTEAMKNFPDCIVSIGDSQILRFIDELNNLGDVEQKIQDIKKKLNREKRKPKSRETKLIIKELYKILYDLQFKKDYLCVVMDSNADYDRANKGFKINGIEYRRLLGTNGGIKNSTIVYVNAELYPELKRRMDNGRNKDVPLVPAKLEAYQALICSGSTPIPQPRGIIVIDDCITKFKDNIIMIDDAEDGEPKMSYIEGYEIEHNDSDGYGLMLPSYSRKVNEYLNGDGENVLSGMNTRSSWLKGMLYTFDFIEFAEQVAHTYEVVDIWGDKRDVREADIILTGSMLKLYNCYNSLEDYLKNCEENHYQLATPKTTPDVLENVRTMNYQFLQSYKFTDEEIEELCKPTIEEIDGVLGLDYRKSLTFLAGFGLNERNILRFEDNYIKALMIEPKLINDPFVRKNIYSMIRKKIECSKKGSIKVNANFAMISGDPYALAQSMFGLEVTGILKAGEAYHKYWIDKGADEIVCFRAPMTTMENIRKMKLNKSEEVLHWYQYISTALIFNAWDTTCDAMNGADKDGDTAMCTDNPILLKRTLNLPTIICVQRKAEKKIVTEEDIIQANKLAFNDDIGTITNYVTSMFEAQAKFSPGSEEYKALDYRIKCGQLYQQNSIDRAKGIIAKPMPNYWYTLRKQDGQEITPFQQSIVAQNKPYFMIYVYPNLKRQYSEYVKNSERKARRKFRNYEVENINQLFDLADTSEEVKEFLYFYEKGKKIGNNPCTVNRICWHMENKYPSYSSIKQKFKDEDFDYEILKCGTEYSRIDYLQIKSLLEKYKHEYDAYMQNSRLNGIDNDADSYSREEFVNKFKMEAQIICSNAQELCDIVLDLCYTTETMKQFAWDVAAETIIENLLKNNGYKLSYPEIGGDEFEFCGEMFSMRTVFIGGEEQGDNIE